VRYGVNPRETDAKIERFLAPNYVVFEKQAPASAPLLVFMPGTGGMPRNTSDFADVAAHQGYKVIGLAYDDEPAVAQTCPRNPDPRCSQLVREKRIYGDGGTDLIDDRPEESIVHRLTALLTLLDARHPGEGWSAYIENGQPRWSRIAVSGLSQGAGMAAYIARRAEVYRVVLFSSPWDNYGRNKQLAPWLTDGRSATPPDRWFAAYHAKEPTADLIERAYRALRIPSDHIRKFTLEPNGRAQYHPSGVANGATPRGADGLPSYLPEWKFLLGKP
jgi:dienelactone hydrolase